jgi:hypothetical protein
MLSTATAEGNDKEINMNQQENVNERGPQETDPRMTREEIERIDDVLADLCVMGETVAGLADQLNQMMGRVIGHRTGRPADGIIELLRSLVQLNDDFHYTETMKEERAA